MSGYVYYNNKTLKMMAKELIHLKVLPKLNDIDEMISSNDLLNEYAYGYLSEMNDHLRTTEVFNQPGYKDLIDDLKEEMKSNN